MCVAVQDSAIRSEHVSNIEEKKSGFENGPGLDYDDPVSLANAKKIATERATEWTNNALPKDGGVKDTDVYVDLKHTNADSGGITFVNKKTGVAYLTLHGKNAGVKGFPRIPANLVYYCSSPCR